MVGGAAKELLKASYTRLSLIVSSHPIPSHSHFPQLGSNPDSDSGFDSDTTTERSRPATARRSALPTWWICTCLPCSHDTLKQTRASQDSFSELPHDSKQGQDGACHSEAPQCLHCACLGEQNLEIALPNYLRYDKVIWFLVENTLAQVMRAWGLVGEPVSETQTSTQRETDSACRWTFDVDAWLKYPRSMPEACLILPPRSLTLATAE